MSPRSHIIPLILLVPACLLSACVSDSKGEPPISAAFDAAPDAPLPEPDAALPDSPPPLCFAPSLEVEAELEVQIQQSCAIWNSLSQIGETAMIEREGESIAIDFGNGIVFAGTVSDEQVSLRYEHEHPFSDNCRWLASETLEGSLDPDSCEMELSYNYRESVAVSDGSCASPCSAQANVSLKLRPVIID